MLYRSWLKLAVIVTAVALLVAMVEAWRADRRDRAQLAAELAATKQLLTAADARQRDRDAQLAQTLSTLDAQKRAVITPTQIIRELANSLPLPAPITLQSRQASSQVISTSPAPMERTTLDASAPNLADGPTGSGNTLQAKESTKTQKSAPDGALIPRADLKPLYDFTLDCQACQAKLSAAQSDLADEKAKTTALTKERDDAVRLAKGGTAWRRLTRAAKWFLLGAAAGAVAAKTKH